MLGPEVRLDCNSNVGETGGARGEGGGGCRRSMAYAHGTGHKLNTFVTFCFSHQSRRLRFGRT